MEKKDWEKRLLEASFIYTGRDVGVIETITFDYDKLKNFISQELDRAREEGYEECKKDMAVGVGLATDTELPEIVSKIASKLTTK